MTIPAVSSSSPTMASSSAWSPAPPSPPAQASASPPVGGGGSTDGLGGILDGIAGLLHRALALPEQASDFAVRVDWLQYGQFSGFWALGLVLFGCTAYFIVRYRRRPDEEGPVRTRRITAPLWLEIGIVGLLLAFFIGSWLVGFRQYVDVATVRPDAQEVYVTGRQWTWTFDYPEGRSTTGVLYLPRDRPVRLLITSRDVIHSFFVPEFRIKRDAVPGRYNSISFTPTLDGARRILCTEYCGTGHSGMWAEVVVLPPGDFDRWLETGQEPATEAPIDPPRVTTPGDSIPRERAALADRGRREAVRLGCLGCHTVDGTIHLAPTWLDLFGRREVLQDGDTVVVDADYITESMMRPQAQIVRGFGPLMPSYQGRVTPSETAAIIEYIQALSSGAANGQADPAGGRDDPAGAGGTP